MRNDDGITRQEQELEAALAGLTPARTGIDRDRVMFCAGRASVQRRTRLWQGLSSALVVLLLVSFVARPVPTEVERGPETIARADVSASNRPVVLVDQEQVEAFKQYVRVRRAVLDRGVEVIPASSGLQRDHHAAPLDREDLEELLSST